MGDRQIRRTPPGTAGVSPGSRPPRACCLAWSAAILAACLT